MSLFKSRHVSRKGLLAAAVGCTMLAGAAVARENDPDARVRVDAPNTAVRVDQNSGKVAVRAPYTAVRVDPDRGRVRVRAPYVNLDIRW